MSTDEIDAAVFAILDGLRTSLAYAAPEVQHLHFQRAHADLTALIEKVTS